MKNPISTDAICRRFPIYSNTLRDRLLIGAENYGDASFLTENEKLLIEISEELLDVSGWAFILWTKVQDLRARLREAENAE